MVEVSTEGDFTVHRDTERDIENTPAKWIVDVNTRPDITVDEDTGDLEANPTNCG